MGDRKAVSNELMDLEKQLEEIDSQIKLLQRTRTTLLDRKKKLEKSLVEVEEGEDHEEWERREFEWSERADCILHETFGLTSFRPLQKATINSVMSGNDTLLLMSTGGGKSLCYQLPAVLTQGLTVVVSPLLSLIEDQLFQLKNIGIEAATLNQNTAKEEVKRIEDAITKQNSSLRLLYVTPEKLAKSKRIMNKLEKSNQVNFLKLIAIDEVHCCSQWGHEFRPDYKFLNVLRRQFKGVPILGLTATAIGTVLDDVKNMLGIPGAIVFRAGFNRPNLKYEVVDKDGDGTTVLVSLLKSRFDNQSGIIYCFTRKECEETALHLRKQGISARHYHAYVEDGERRKTHAKWLSGECLVIVATVAFGMGIDKENVRFVIHHTIPKSMENYYQESGRAGRDGGAAVCVLLWKVQDLFRQSTMVCTERNGLSNLYTMAKYATNVDCCRRISFSAHFDEAWEPEWCQRQCDVCAGERSRCEFEASSIARKAVQLIAEEKKTQKGSSSGRLTGAKLIENLCKAGENRKTVENAVAFLVLDGYLQEDFHFTPYSVISYIEEGSRFSRLRNDPCSSVKFFYAGHILDHKKKPGMKRSASFSKDKDCDVVLAKK